MSYVLFKVVLRVFDVNTRDLEVMQLICHSNICLFQSGHNRQFTAKNMQQMVFGAHNRLYTSPVVYGIYYSFVTCNTE